MKQQIFKPKPNLLLQLVNLWRRRLCLVILVVLSTVTALLAHAQEKINIKRKNISVENVFSIVRSTTDYRFVYDSQRIGALKPIDIDLKDASINTLLDVCLKSSSLSYVIDNKTVIIRNNRVNQSVTDLKQEQVVSGRVIHKSSKEALAGVTVTLLFDGLNDIITVTDQNGRFHVSYAVGVKVNKIRFALVGMQTLEMPLNNRSELQVELSDSVQELDDIVVTGIFNKSKETYTGASKEISAADLQEFKGRNLFVTLGNIDPSFYVMPDNMMGSDPNKIPDIQLRGTSSMPNINQLQDATAANLNTPLVVLDGFETTLQRMMDLDVNEVESITLLKDGSATALYGSRGANGVIVIKTRAPQAGKLRLYYKAGINTNLPDISSYNLLDAREKLELERLSGYYQNSTKSAAENIKLQQYYNQILGIVESGVNTNWLAKPLRTGIDQNHTLRMEGGDAAFRYSVAATYNDVQGVMKGSGRQVFNGSAKLTYNYDKFMFSNQTIIGNTRTDESPYGSFSEYAKLNPYWSPYDEQGNVVRVFEPYEYTYWTQPTMGLTRPYANPLYDATLNNYNRGNTTSIINNLQVEWRPITGLILRGTAAVTSDNNSSDDFKPANHSMFNEYADEDLFYKGRYIYGSGKGFSYTGSFMASYAHTFDDKHDIYIGLNTDVAENKTTAYSITAEGFPDENVDFLPMALTYQRNGRPGGNESVLRRVGVLANANYSYKYKYIADFSYRLDGASQFGSNTRFAPFWSAGLAWNLHRENFFKNSLDFVNVLKLRASYGLTGSTQFSAYQSHSVFQYYMDQRYGPWLGAYQNSLGNPDLKWQRTSQYNLGVDLELFNSRLSLRGDVYRKNTTNLLSSLELPFSNGFTEYNENVGAVRAEGIELSSSYKILPASIKDWNWSVTGNLVYTRDRIVELSQAMKEANDKLLLNSNSSPNQILLEGASQNTIYVVRSLGIDPSNGREIFLTKDGDVTYQWSASDRVAAGLSQPKYRGNISTLLRYKQLTLNASLGFRFGGQMYNSTLIDKVELPDKFYNVDRRVFTDRWVKPGDQARFRGLNENGVAYVSSRFVQNESSLFLQNVNVNYSILNKPWLKRIGVSTLSLGVNTGELFYWSTINQERGTAYPYSRQVSFTVSALF